MTRYRNKRYLEEINEDIDEHVIQQEEEIQRELNVPSIDAEDDAFKKRYGDLRRHAAQVEAELNQRIKDLEAKLETEGKRDLNLPDSASEEDIEEWLRNYPKVGSIVSAIAKKQASEALEIAKKANEKADKSDFEKAKAEALNEIARKHPDVQDIFAAKEFWDWLNEQSEWVQNSILKSIEPKGAISTLNLYKMETGKATPKKSGQDDRSAAASVPSHSSAPSPKGGERYDFSESQIEKMSQREYEKNEAAINEAMRAGRIKYDISGGAR